MKAGPGHLPTGERRGRKAPRHGQGQPDIQSMWVGDINEEGEYVIPSYYADEEYTLSEGKARELQQRHRLSQRHPQPLLEPLNQDFLSPRNITRFGAIRDLTPPVRTPDLASPPPTPLSPGSPPTANDALLPPNALFSRNHRRSASGISVLSVDSVVGDKKDFKLQKVDPFFTDSSGEYYKAFDDKLKILDGKTSEGPLCIEDYLVKSERKWFNKFRDARLGRTPVQSRPSSPPPSMSQRSRPTSPTGSLFNDATGYGKSEETRGIFDDDDEYLLGRDYKPPTGLRKYMQVRIGDWPLYSFFLAFGQIIAANSYQITLLTGTVGQTAEKLYVVASIYLLTSLMWWFCFRYFKSIYVLSIPFFFYGFAVSNRTPGLKLNSPNQKIVSPRRRGPLCIQHKFQRLGPEYGNSHVCHRLLQRFHLLRSQFWRRRRRSYQSMGLPRVRYPRHSASLRYRPLVLG